MKVTFIIKRVTKYELHRQHTSTSSADTVFVGEFLDEVTARKIADIAAASERYSNPNSEVTGP